MPYKEDELECPTISGNIVWLFWTNVALLIFYSIEAIAKIYVARCKYFWRAENNLDLSICVTGWLAEAFSHMFSASWLRIFRLWRLVRVLNAMNRVDEIHMLIAGLAGAFRAILFGAVVLGFSLLFSSLFIVQFVHPIAITLDFPRCERCARGYRSVQDSMMTLFQQTVAGDSWGSINVPVIEKEPLVGMLLPVVHIMVAIGVMNLILAVVVDRSVQAREQNTEKVRLEKQSARLLRKMELLKNIHECDARCPDKSRAH